MENQKSILELEIGKEYWFKDYNPENLEDLCNRLKINYYINNKVRMNNTFLHLFKNKHIRKINKINFVVVNTRKYFYINSFELKCLSILDDKNYSEQLYIDASVFYIVDTIFVVNKKIKVPQSLYVSECLYPNLYFTTLTNSFTNTELGIEVLKDIKNLRKNDSKTIYRFFEKYNLENDFIYIIERLNDMLYKYRNGRKEFVVSTSEL